MTHDPFGNLTDWGPVLRLFYELADSEKLTECQAGLVRILRYKGNWRLREEVLKRIGEIPAPSRELLCQVLTIVSDDNIYYEARILASDALIQLSNKRCGNMDNELLMKIRKAVEKLNNTPQPPFFDMALKRLYFEIDPPDAMLNRF
jgi:hypothetical protein